MCWKIKRSDNMEPTFPHGNNTLKLRPRILQQSLTLTQYMHKYLHLTSFCLLSYLPDPSKNPNLQLVSSSDNVYPNIQIIFLAIDKENNNYNH